MIQSHPSWFSTAKYMIIAGARPNVITSTSESSSEPNRDPLPVARATRPSSASATPPSTIAVPRNQTVRAKQRRSRTRRRTDSRVSVRLGRMTTAAAFCADGRSPSASCHRCVIGSRITAAARRALLTPAVGDVAQPWREACESTGMKTSTREPNRMMPIRSPCFTCSPTLL